MDLDAVVVLLAGDLEVVIADTLVERSPMPALAFAARVVAADREVEASAQDADNLGESVAILVLTRWIVSAQSAWPADAWGTPVIEWVGSCLGPRCAEAASLAQTAVTSLNDGRQWGAAVQQLGNDFLPALVWLSCGLVEEYGNGDSGWLRERAAQLE